MANEDYPEPERDEASVSPESAAGQAEAGPVGGAKTLDLGGYIGRAWDLVMANLGLFVGAYAVVSLIMVAASVTVIGSIVLGGPFAFGFMGLIRKRLHGQDAEFGDVFSGFDQFGKAFVFVLILTLLGAVTGLVLVIASFVLIWVPCVGTISAILLCIAVPVFLSTVTYFALPIAVFSDAPPMDAVKNSIDFSWANFDKVFLLSLITCLIASCGSILCGVGVLLTVPVGAAIQIIAYEEFYLPKVS